jgi:alpha-ribazole phosphatase/probable phosphoglycerate mutase
MENGIPEPQERFGDFLLPSKSRREANVGAEYGRTSGTTEAAKTAWLIRHGEVEPGHEGKFVGRLDVPLGDRGARQARALGRIIPPPPRLALCSPSLRARRTAELALGEAAGEIFFSEDLMEADFGRWEGLSFADIERTDPALVKEWAAFEPAFAFPGGERLSDFLRRVERFAARIAAAREERVVVFTHGGIIRSLLCLWLGLAPRDYLKFEVRPAGVVKLLLHGHRGVLLGLDNSMAEVL